MAYIPNWQKGTGSYVIKELATQDTVLKHLDVGTKYLECTSAGTMAIPSKTAYGTWEWSFYKGADGNLSPIYFINDKSDVFNTTYRFNIHSNEAIYFQEYTGGGFISTHMNTAVSYILINTWYRMKITRTKDGEFYLYIKGGSFGNVYVLIDVTGGSGTNPVTDNSIITSEYFMVDFDAGDRLANLTIHEGVTQ